MTILRRKELRHLLNKLNKVTACHRHGREIPESYLDDLCNAQVDYEQSDLTEMEQLVESFHDGPEEHDKWKLQNIKETVMHRMQIKKSKWKYFIQAIDEAFRLLKEEKERRT